MPAARTWTRDSTLTAVVFCAAVLGSSYNWFELAVACGWPVALAWVPFVSIDVGGLTFGMHWVNGPSRKIRAWGAATTICAVVVSVAGNGIQHALSGGFLHVSIWLNLAVGAVPAVSLFATVHQWALGKRHLEQVATPPTATQPDEQPAPDAPPVETVADEVQERRERDRIRKADYRARKRGESGG